MLTFGRMPAKNLDGLATTATPGLGLVIHRIQSRCILLQRSEPRHRSSCFRSATPIWYYRPEHIVRIHTIVDWELVKNAPTSYSRDTFGHIRSGTVTSFGVCPSKLSEQTRSYENRYARPLNAGGKLVGSVASKVTIDQS